MVQSRRTRSAVSLSSKKRAHVLSADDSRWLMLLSVLNAAEMNGNAMSYFVLFCLSLGHNSNVCR